jgi:hypothetical protein
LTALVVVFVAFLAACVIGFFVGFVGLAALFEKFFAAFFVAVVVSTATNTHFFSSAISQEWNPSVKSDIRGHLSLMAIIETTSVA